MAHGLRRLLAIGGTFVLAVLAACSGADDDVADTTPPPADDTCRAADLPADHYEVDIDDVQPAEVVFLRPDESTDSFVADRHELVVCGGEEALFRLEIEGQGLAILGFVDLGSDGPSEVLLSADTERGTVVTAVTLTARGLALTDLTAERWIQGGEASLPEAPFDASGFECDDVDADGRLDLLVTNYRPADDVVHVEVALIVLDGTSATAAPVDAYETDVEQALRRWREPDRCDQDALARVGVDAGANGWGRVDSGDAFAGDGDAVLTGIARGGSEDLLVAVGVEAPSMLVGEYFPPRPAIWTSADAVTWERAELGDAEGELRSVAALPDGTGFVAVGQTESSAAAAWWSTDGRRWTLVEVQPAASGSGVQGAVMSDVASTPLGLVAVGSEGYAADPGVPGEDIDPAVWLSADGRSWERIEHPAFGTVGYQPNDGTEFNGEFVGVAHRPGVGIVVVGSASDPTDPTVDFPRALPAAWTSADGRRWQRHDIDAELRLRGVTATSQGLLAHGVSTISGSPSQDGAILMSTDGVRWREVPGPLDGIGDVDGAQAVNLVIEVPDVGLLAGGTDETEFETSGAAAAWWSYDQGPTWGREEHDDRIFEALGAPPTATMTDAIWSGDRLVVVGFSGRSITAPGGGSACCVLEPEIWIWPAPDGG